MNCSREVGKENGWRWGIQDMLGDGWWKVKAGGFGAKRAGACSWLTPDRSPWGEANGRGLLTSVTCFPGNMLLEPKSLVKQYRQDYR